MARQTPVVHSYDRSPTQTALPPCPPCDDCDCCCEEVVNDVCFPFVGDLARYLDMDRAWGEFAFEYTDPWSFSFWTKYDDTVHSSADGILIMRLGNNPGDTFPTGWWVGFHPSGTVRAYVQTDTFGDNTNPQAILRRFSAGGVNLIDGAWHHVVIVKSAGADPQAITIFIDGATDNGAYNPSTNMTGTAIPPVIGNTKFRIGQGQNASTVPLLPLDQYIDEPMIFGKALTASEVQFLRGSTATNQPCVPGLPLRGNDPPELCPSDLLVWYRMGDDPLDKLVATGASPGPPNMEDQGPNARNGTPVGYTGTDYFVMDCPVACDCDGSGNPSENPQPDPQERWTYICQFPPEKSVISDYSAELVVAPFDDIEFPRIQWLNLQYLGAVAGTVSATLMNNACSAVEWSSDTPPAANPVRGSFSGADYSTFSVWTPTAVNINNAIICYDVRSSQMAWFDLHANAWLPQPDHTMNIQLGAETDFPGIEGVIAGYNGAEGGAAVDPFVLMKYASNDLAIADTYATYDPLTQVWFEGPTTIINGAWFDGTTIASGFECSAGFMTNRVFVGAGNSQFIYVYTTGGPLGGWSPVPIGPPSMNHYLKRGCSMAFDLFTGDLYCIWVETESNPDVYELWRLNFVGGNWTQLASPPLVSVGGPVDLCMGKSIQKMHWFLPKGSTILNGLFKMIVPGRRGVHWNVYDPPTNTWVSLTPPETGKRRWQPTGPNATIVRRKS